MKKLIFGAAVLASAFFAASCQQEMLDPQAEGTTVTYTVEVPDAIATKAIGDEITAVDKVYFEVYRAAEVGDPTKTPVYEGGEPLTDNQASFDLEFVKDQNFVVLFWAQNSALVKTDQNTDGMYNIDDLRAIQLVNPGAANNSAAQVFAGKDTVSDCVSAVNGNVTLTRPVSQINVYTTTESLSFGDVTIGLDQSSMTVAGLYNTFNVATGDAVVSDENKATFVYTKADVPTVAADNAAYKYVAMNYVGFASQAGTTATVDFTIWTTTEAKVIEHTVSNVPVKPNYRTNIVGNLISATTDYTVSLNDNWADAGKDMEVLADGIVKFNDSGVYQISNAHGLAYASQNLFAKVGGSYVLTEDIDMAGASSVVTKAAEGYTWNSAALTHKMTTGSSFEFDGAGHTIKNLPGMFIAYTGSAKSVVVKNLTLETPNVAFNVEDTPATDGVGAFIGYAGTSTTITLDNCHVKGGKIEGGHWTGGLVGYAAGYSGTDGPVFETLTIKDCSVKNAEITGKGSCGGIIGHATGDAWTLVDMDNVAVAFNKIISTGSDDNKAGSVMGTLGNAGQPTTVNGVTKTGGVTIDNYEASVNDVKSNNVVNTKLWGRQGNSNGVLTINGEKVTDFNAGVATTNAITVSNDEELYAAIAGATGDMIIKLAEGTYSNDINLTVAEYGGAKGDLVFKAVEGAEPVIAGTVTLGLFVNKTTKVAKWEGNVTFEGITFDHAESKNNSISVQNVGKSTESNALTLKNCKIIADGEYGILGESGCIANNSRIIGCTFINAALQPHGNFGTGLVVDGCTFTESCINVQGGNGVTVQNCNFTNTLTENNVGDSFYVIRSQNNPITVSNCTINVNSELTDVKENQVLWGLLWNRGATNQWTLNDVKVNMSDAAIMQTELMITKPMDKLGKYTTNPEPYSITNFTVNNKPYACTSASLTSAVNAGATDIYVEGNFKMPTSSTSNAIIITSLNGKATIDNTLGSYWDNATLTFDNIKFKTGTGMANGNGSDYAALYSKNVTYNKCSFSGPMRLGRDGAKFVECTFNDLGNDYVWTYGNAATFEGCTFNSAGKAILIYSDGPTVGTGAAPAVSVTNCTFNATQGAKAGAIANQNCAAVEIHNYGNGVTLTTSGNTVDEEFSGVWRIKTYENRFPDSKIFVNGTEYTTIALDGKTMTIDANKNVTVL